MQKSYNVKYWYLPISILVFLQFPYSMKAQINGLVVLNSGGYSFTTNINSPNLTYSIGEMSSIQEYKAMSNYLLSTGFLQSFTPLITNLNEVNPFPGQEISIGPNPTVNFIQLRTDFKKYGVLQFQVVDANSKIIYQQAPISLFGKFQKQVELNDQPAGSYYLRIRFQPRQGSLRQENFKIIKL